MYFPAWRDWKSYPKFWGGSRTSVLLVVHARKRRHHLWPTTRSLRDKMKNEISQNSMWAGTINCESTLPGLMCYVIYLLAFHGRTRLVYTVHWTFPFWWKWLGLACETRAYKIGPQDCSLGFGRHSVSTFLCYMTSPHLKSSPIQASLAGQTLTQEERVWSNSH